MSAMWQKLVPRLRTILRHGAAERDLDEELRYHLERQTELYATRGLSPQEAQRQARLDFGAAESVKEECREAWGFVLLRTIPQDFRYAARVFAKTPLLTAVAVLSLALGIGANTALFSLLDATLRKSLPVRDPERLVRAVIVHADRKGWHTNVGDSIYEELNRAPASFSDVFAFVVTDATLRGAGGAERVREQLVTGNYYSALGVKALRGRTLEPDDDLPGQQNPACVLSYSFWARRFGRDPSVLGQILYLGRMPVTVVGVTPPEFPGAEPGWEPDVTVAFNGTMGKYGVNVWARLKPGVTLRQAQVEMDAAFGRCLEQLQPRVASWPESNRRRALSQRGELRLAGRGSANFQATFEEPLKVLPAFAVVVLLIACANIANLFLARGNARANEIGLRLALGAGRSRLIRQLLTESLLLSALGALLGILCAIWSHRALLALLVGERVPEALRFRLDLRVLAFTAAVTVITGLLSGLVPALRATRLDVNRLLNREPRPAGAIPRNRLGRCLVVAQVAAAVALLAGAGLLTRTLINLRSVGVGFKDPGSLLTLRLDLSQRYVDGAALVALYEDILQRVRVLPGLGSAAFAENDAFGGGSWKTVYIPGHEHGPAESPQCGFNYIGPGFLATAGVPLVAGRELSARDTVGAPETVVVNQTFARKYWPKESAIGRRTGIPQDRAKWEIVGVVADAHYGNLRASVPPMMYHALYQQEKPRSVTLHVRTLGDPLRMASQIRQAIVAVDKDVPVFEVRTLAARVDRSLGRERMFATLSGFFGLLALGLTAIGLYGVVAYATARRTSEIGVRIALGASRAAVVWMVLRGTLALIGAGAIIGIPIALAVTRLVRGLLFGLTPADPATLAGVTLVLLLVGVLAGYLPARRAASLSPTTALRYE